MSSFSLPLALLGWANDTLNPTLGSANAVRFAALWALYRAHAAHTTNQQAIAASSFLHDIPARQSVVHETGQEGETAIYRHFRAPLYPDALPSVPFPGVSTLYENFVRSVRLFPGSPCLGHRPLLIREKEKGEREKAVEVYAGDFVWRSYQAIYNQMSDFGSGMVRVCGLDKGAFVGIMMANRPEWVVAEQACNAYSLVTVPLYDTLGYNVVEFICNEAQLSVCVCSKESLQKLLVAARSCPSLKHIICVDGDVSQKDIAEAKHLKISLHLMSDLEAQGRVHRIPHRPPLPTDLATLCYTSGTTGNPKGAMLTHRNFLASHSALVSTMTSQNIDENDIHLSYLPLAHVFERFIQMVCLGRGAAIGFYQGDPLKLLDDLATLRPTIFISVPRIYNRVFDKIMAGVSASPVKKALFDFAFGVKFRRFKETGAVVDPFWDSLLFGKIAAALGGRVRMMITGSAPISPEVLNFFRVCFSCHVIEGYGQTESCALGCGTLIGENQDAMVGPPFACVEVKLVDVPDMNYRATDKPYPRGELCMRGPNVFIGYFKNPEKTVEALDSDGWLHSGDVAAALPNGTFKIIDRKKNIFKLSQGEYIAPEKIESELSKCKWVGQAFVHGDSLEAFLVAVIVPDEEVLKGWATTQPELASLSTADLCRHSSVKALVFKDLLAQAKESKLNGFEIPKAIYLSHEPFTLENEILTPTMKLKRNVAQKHFEKEIAQLYEEAKGASAKL